MFYAQFVLAKKGPLAKIWLAAHWEKKLTKAQIYETDVPQAIEEVIRPKVKMALRTVGHLLLGIVRIYSKKTRYLLADTNEAYHKMKINFRDGFTFEADIPLNAADIDENFANIMDDFNISVPEFHDADYNEKLILANVSRLEDITIKDDVNYNAMFQINVEDDGFGDEGDYAQQLEQFYGSVEPASFRPTPQPESLMSVFQQDAVVFPEEDGMERVRRLTSASEVSARNDGTVLLNEASGAPGASVYGAEDMDFGNNFNNIKQENQTNIAMDFEPMDHGNAEMFNSMIQDRPVHYDEPMNFGFEPEAESEGPGHAPRTPESFALEPLDLENMEGRKKRQRKPRKLLVDAETMLTNEVFREQQEDFTDTMKPTTLAPPSKQMLKMCVTGDLPYLMTHPGSMSFNKELLGEYRKSLVTRQFDPNFTMQELSDSSSFTPSVDREAPWEQLGLNEDIPDEFGIPGPAGVAPDDQFFDDLEDYPMPAPELDFDRTLNQHDENNHQNQIDFDPVPVPMPYYEENKENEPEEEDWTDPFGGSGSSMSNSSKRGRLESYGFGSVSHKPSAEEEGKWTKRANHILKKVSTEIETSGQAAFSKITESAKTRKQAAEQFYSLLSLAKSKAISVEQAEPYGEILIRAGDRFHDALNPTPAKQNETNRTPMRPISST